MRSPRSRRHRRSLKVYEATVYPTGEGSWPHQRSGIFGPRTYTVSAYSKGQAKRLANHAYDRDPSHPEFERFLGLNWHTRVRKVSPTEG